MAWADLTDCRAYYELIGEGEPLLLIPGLGAQGGRIEDAAPAFTPHPAAGLVVAARSVIEAWREAGGDFRHAVAAAAQEHRTTTWNVVRHAFA